MAQRGSRRAARLRRLLHADGRIASLPPTLPELLADILARLRRESPRLVWQPPSADADADGGTLRWLEVYSTTTTTRSPRLITTH